MEVMIALVVFSILIGTGSRFIAAGVSQPFVSDRVEPWLRLMEDSRTALQALSPGDPLLTAGVHDHPFTGLPQPAAMTHWQLEWKSTSLDGYRAAAFIATTPQDRIIEWYVFYKDP